MQLYLIRHAEAEDIGTGGVTRDFDRPLSKQGRADARALAGAFSRRNLTLDAVAASPLVRAHQTATELVSALDPALRVVTCDELSIDRLKPGKLSEFLAALPAGGSRVPSRAEKAVAAIGHMPDLATYLEWLLGASAGTMRFAKAGAALVSFEDGPARGGGELEWLITPNWLS